MSAAPALSAVLFDMDGVLLRSQEAWLQVLEEAGRHFRGHPVTREEFLPTFGQGTEADVRVFRLGCTPAQLNAFYARHLPRFATGVWVNPEARGVLEALGRRRVLRAVVTNTTTPLARALLGAAHLDDLLECLSCADEGVSPKPAPDLLLRALAQLAVGPSAALMVGDSRFDRDAAAAAAVRFVGLGLDGDVRIERLEELLALAPPRGGSGP